MHILTRALQYNNLTAPFFFFVFIKGSAPHGTPCPVRTDPFGVCLSIFCLFPCICIHFELVDVPNKAVK